MVGRASKMMIPAFLLLAVLLLASDDASAHSPTFPHGNTSLADAWEVHDPAKSWAVYAELGAGEVNYYRMEFKEGERIFLMLITPVNEGKQGFLPRMALIGPGLSVDPVTPSFVVVPSGYGSVAIPSQRSDTPQFEAFSPSGFYEISSYDKPANMTGTYYVAVWNDDPLEGGSYGFPVGFLESFTIEEMITIPISLVQVYHWTGQDYVLVFLPTLITMVLGAGILVRNKLNARHMGVSRHMVYWAGVLVIGTGITTAVQLALTMADTPLDTLVSVTLLLIAGQILLGTLLARYAWARNDGLSLSGEAIVIVLALVALFIWGGYIIGPVMAIIGALTSRWGWFRK